MIIRSMRWLGIRRKRLIRGALTCSFCGRHRDEVAKLVAGPGVYICGDCVVLAVRELAKPR